MSRLAVPLCLLVVSLAPLPSGATAQVPTIPPLPVSSTIGGRSAVREPVLALIEVLQSYRQQRRYLLGDIAPISACGIKLTWHGAEFTLAPHEFDYLLSSIGNGVEACSDVRPASALTDWDDTIRSVGVHRVDFEGRRGTLRALFRRGHDIVCEEATVGRRIIVLPWGVGSISRRGCGHV